MDLSVTLFVLLELVVGATATVVAYVAWTYRDRPAGRPLFAMSVTGVAYAATSVVESVAADPVLWELATNLQYPLTAAIAVESFYLSVEFTHRESYRRRSVDALLGGVVLVDLCVSLTNPLHHLMTTPPTRVATGAFTTTYGPLFWAHTLVSMAIILASVTLLAAELVSADRIYREQVAATIVGFLVGIAFFLWESVAPIHPAFNLATVGIVGWCFATLWGVFRVDLLETSRIARETLVDSMGDAVIALDTEGNIVDTNPAARDRFGIGSDAVGTPAEDAFSDHPPLLNALDAGGDECDVALRSGTGSERHYRVKQSPVSDTRLGDQRVRLGRTVVIEDITDRKTRKRALERQNESLDEFVSVVSHDLRNPLNVAEGRVELAREECDSDHLDAVERSHDRMEALIEDLLTLARSGRTVDELHPTDLSAVVERGWRNVDTGGATLSVEADADVLADGARLQQLLENLLRNAVEHGSTDGRHAEFTGGENGTAGRPSRSGDGVERVPAAGASDEFERGGDGDRGGVSVTVGALADGFYVADDGPGIDAAERGSVFESGYSTADDGTGLGLHIVERITEAHGWTVDVTESAEGGARFEIRGVDVAP